MPVDYKPKSSTKVVEPARKAIISGTLTTAILAAGTIGAAFYFYSEMESQKALNRLISADLDNRRAQLDKLQADKADLERLADNSADWIKQLRSNRELHLIRLTAFSACATELVKQPVIVSLSAQTPLRDMFGHKNMTDKSNTIQPERLVTFSYEVAMMNKAIFTIFYAPISGAVIPVSYSGQWEAEKANIIASALIRCGREMSFDGNMEPETVKPANLKLGQRPQL